MNLFDLTPAGALMNAMDAAAEKDRQISRMEIERGIYRPPLSHRIANRLSSALEQTGETTRRLRYAAGNWLDAVRIRLMHRQV